MKDRMPPLDNRHHVPQVTVNVPPTRHQAHDEEAHDPYAIDRLPGVNEQEVDPETNREHDFHPEEEHRLADRVEAVTEGVEDAASVPGTEQLSAHQRQYVTDSRAGTVADHPDA